jgi:flagellar M-ring protein FliF
MNGVVGNLINALAEIWRSIGIPQKVSIVLIGIATLGATALIIFFGSQPDWQILYSNMDSKTAAKIYDVVKDSNVQVKLTDSGRTIMVPSTDVYKLRMKVVNEGIPVDNSGDGWGLFDEMKLGLTDRQQQIAFQRAVQGELQKMIKEMPGIIGCSVMLTIPKKKVFTKSQTNPSASIMVVVEQGRALSRQQVNSIRYLVSSAVSVWNLTM